MSFELQPHLVGDLLELRPLRPEDWEGLFAVAADPMIWEQHPAYDRYQEEVFREFFRGALESGGAFVAIDRATQKIVGSSRYFGYDPEKREIEIGWTFLERSHWGGKYNGEMKRLMLGHAFQFVDRVLFVVGPTNYRSRRAVEKLGAVRRGVRGTSIHGKMVEQVVYQVTKGLCPDCRFARVIRNDRGTVFLQCGKSFEDARFVKYPRLPVLACAGYEREEKGG